MAEWTFSPPTNFPIKEFVRWHAAKLHKRAFFFLLTKQKQTALCAAIVGRRKKISLSRLLCQKQYLTIRNTLRFILSFSSQRMLKEIWRRQRSSDSKNQFIRYCADLIHCSVHHISNWSFLWEDLEIILLLSDFVKNKCSKTVNSSGIFKVITFVFLEI